MNDIFDGPFDIRDCYLAELANDSAMLPDMPLRRNAETCQFEEQQTDGTWKPLMDVGS